MKSHKTTEHSLFPRNGKDYGINTTSSHAVVTLTKEYSDAINALFGKNAPPLGIFRQYYLIHQGVMRSDVKEQLRHVMLYDEFSFYRDELVDGMVHTDLRRKADPLHQKVLKEKQLFDEKDCIKNMRLKAHHVIPRSQCWEGYSPGKGNERGDIVLLPQTYHNRWHKAFFNAEARGVQFKLVELLRHTLRPEVLEILLETSKLFKEQFYSDEFLRF